MVTARRCALKALGAWRKSGAWSGIYLDKLIKSEGLDEREAGLAWRITLGVLRTLALCDFYIQSCSAQKLKKLEPVVLDILRIGAYQIVFLDKVPDFSAVDESVKLAKRLSNPRAAGFVNAVLRRLAAERESLPEPPKGNAAEYFSVKYSHPLWLASRFVEMLGADEAEKLLAINNRSAPLHIQANTLKAGPDELFNTLSAVRSGVFEGAAMLEKSGTVDKLPEFKAGKFFVQDISARCAVEAAGVKPGDSVLDLCAAPGGKSFMAAILMENKGFIKALDIYEKKLKLVEAGAKRLGISIISTEAGDASLYDPRLEAAADVVLADVPCSGLGIVRKKPEIRYKAPDDLQKLPELQLSILKNAARYVKRGGVLLYSTCTLLPEENEDVVEAFLAENEAFAPEEFRLPEPFGKQGSGMMTIWPHIFGFDGFFIAKLRNKDET